VSFDKLGNCVRVTQNGKRLLQRFEIVWTDENSGRCPVAGDDDTFMMFLNSFDKLGETVSNGSQRFAHGHNCATPELKLEDIGIGALTVIPKRTRTVRNCIENHPNF